MNDDHQDPIAGRLLSRVDFEAALPLYVGGDLAPEEARRVGLWAEEHPEDEVTVTFKTGSKVTQDVNWVSFVKESSVFGALHGAIKPGSLDELESPSIISQGLTFESICLAFALGVALLVACRRRCLVLVGRTQTT